MTKNELKQIIKEAYLELKNEAAVNDPKTVQLINDFGKLTEELNGYKERLKQMETLHGEMEEQIRGILEAIEDVEDKTLATEQFVAEITRKGFSRDNIKYKDAFNLALKKVNEATRRVLNEAVEATKGVSKVASAIGIKRISEDSGVPTDHVANIERAAQEIELANKVLSRLSL